MTVPYSFKDRSGAIPLRELDENFDQIDVDLTNTIETVNQSLEDTTNTINQSLSDLETTLTAADTELQNNIDDIEDPVAMALLFGPDPQPDDTPAAGTVIQVQNFITGVTSYVDIPASYDSYTDVPNISVSITPKYSTSKMYIIVRWFGEYSANNEWNGMFGLKRNDAPIGRGQDFGGPTSTGGAIGTTQSSSSYQSDANSTPEVLMFDMIDYPNTTNQVIYQLYYNNVVGTGTLYTNRCVNGGKATSGTTISEYELGTTSITVMEIMQ